ncbi:MAG: divergent polysaccharide deacetylase family protein [Pseudomonadota bacterium]
MRRGFIAGLIWGAIVCLLVTVAASALIRPSSVTLAEADANAADDAPAPGQVRLPPGSEFNRNRPETTPVIPEAETARSSDSAPSVATPETEAAPVADTSPAGTPATATDAAASIGTPATEPGAQPRVIAQTDVQGSLASPSAPLAPGSAAPASPVLETVPAQPPAPPATGGVVAVAEPEVSTLTPQPETTALPIIGSGETADAAEEAPEAPDEVPDEVPVTEEIAEVAETSEPVTQENTEEAVASVEPTVTDRTGGAQTNRLPTIGGTVEEDEPAEAPEASAEEAEAEVEVAGLGALARNSAPFEDAEGRPLFSVVLIDVGGEGLARDSLTTFSFPVTFAIDPTRPDATEAAEAYRAAGHEVLILADGLPDNAQPSDVEVLLTGYIDLLPQAMGVVDTSDNGFQTKRDLVSQVVQIVGESGHGLLTYDRGLNSAQQIAAREGVPAALVFRELDADQENTGTIKRYLDRAAFRAAQEGQVVMVGRTYPETVTALFAWALEARSQTVKLAPLSAVMRAQ